VVGVALLWTLEKGLGDGWTPEVADAWGTAYGTLSGCMISEAYGRTRAAE
jgi:hemoglobin-like flavoprotein